MKTLSELCVPKKNIFSTIDDNDVLDLVRFEKGKIDPTHFFSETYITSGMKILLSEAFKRFKGETDRGIIKLTQSMGGGKTHNMIALGLLAQHSHLRSEIIDENFKGIVRVATFSGRNSNTPNGIAGAIATQIGRAEVFKDVFATGGAPDQTQWTELLQDKPTLILLDELPPYMNYLSTQTSGAATRADVEVASLSTLFNAIAQPELSNVLLVISDLTGTYEKGSQYLEDAMNSVEVYRNNELEGELNRHSLDITPVKTSSNEIFHILRTKLFDKIPNEDEIEKIALTYKKGIESINNTYGVNVISPIKIYNEIKESYPFHPFIKEAYLRFKENGDFQQTRGLIRLMRRFVSQMFSVENSPSRNKYLIHAHDFDLSDSDIFSFIIHIKKSIEDAIIKDVYDNGSAIAELEDKKKISGCSQDIAKLFLFSSLSTVKDKIKGLTEGEVLAYSYEFNKSLSSVKESYDAFIDKSFYLKKDKDARYYFAEVKNINAELNNYISTLNKDAAKKELREYLSEQFSPYVKDVYKNILVFPNPSEMEPDEKNITLVLCEPHANVQSFEAEDLLSTDILSAYTNITYKNRIMFLTGNKNTMNRLIESAKKYKAIKMILETYKDEGRNEKDHEYEVAKKKIESISMELRSSAMQTFTQLVYPKGKEGKLMSDAFEMRFVSNSFKGEDEVRNVLIKNGKFETYDFSTLVRFKKKSEKRLFNNQKEAKWKDIYTRAATNTLWNWHTPEALDSCKNELIKRDEWREDGGFIYIGPFEKDPSVVIIREHKRDEVTGVVQLKLEPFPTNAIVKVKNSIGEFELVDHEYLFETENLEETFTCEDPANEHPNGTEKIWTNTIKLTDKLHKVEDKTYVTLKSLPNIPIYFTLNGSEPVTHGEKYEAPVLIEKNMKLLAIAKKDNHFSNKVERDVGPIDSEVVVEIPPDRDFTFNRKQKTNSLKDTYSDIDKMKKTNGTFKKVSITFDYENINTSKNDFVDLQFSEDFSVNAEKLEVLMNNIRNNFDINSLKSISLDYRPNFKNKEDFVKWLSEKQIDKNDLEEGDIE